MFKETIEILETKVAHLKNRITDSNRDIEDYKNIIIQRFQTQAINLSSIKDLEDAIKKLKGE
jgi:chaperonin cofactor prefoldin